MNSLVLIRHGLTRPDETLPPAEWPLFESDSSRALGPLLPAGHVVASDERKAIETAQALGRDFSVDARLREISRPWISDPEAFKVSVQRYLDGEDVDGWEPQRVALGRFAEAARGLVVSHGTIMSLFVASIANVDANAFCSALRMPDAWELTGRNLRRLEPTERTGKTR